MNTHARQDSKERGRASANSELRQTTAQRATAATGGHTANGLNGLGQLLNNSPRVAQLARLKQTMDSRQNFSVQRKPETGLPEDLQNGLESLSGLNLDDVAVHYNSPEPAKVAAHAVTQGKNIHLAPGQQRHLNHEAWHVVQQLQDRVKPTTQIAGVQVNDDPGLEREADHMGARAEQTGAPQHAPVAQARAAGSLQTGTVSQRQPWTKLLAPLGMYGAFMAKNAYQQYDINKNPEKYIEGENEEQGRLRAVHETSKGKPGQASYAMRPPVSLAHLFLGNIGGSKIGGHYAYDIPDLLKGPDTNEALDKIGTTETEDYWAKQKGFPGWLGGRLSAGNRSNTLKSSRDFRKKWGI